MPNTPTPLGTYPLRMIDYAYKYNKTFSGTDTLAFILFPGCSPVCLGALTTISYSMYRNKKPVINIGRTNINGVTRGSRIFAGTMIFTLINQHWLREVLEHDALKGWLGQYNELKVDELPLFDIMIISANEYGSWCNMYIYGIDFTDEAQTVSVEDLFTENTFSFVARDISTFKARDALISTPEKSEGTTGSVEKQTRYYILDNSAATLEDIGKLEKEFYVAKEHQRIEEIEKIKSPLTRELYESTSKTYVGNDVADIQTMLNQTRMFNLDVNGIFDHEMDQAVRMYQSHKGMEINGIVDERFYVTLKQDTPNSERIGYIVNKYGAYVYRDASMISDIVDTKNYKAFVPIYEVVANNDDGVFQRFYRTDTGYIIESDVYSAYYTGSVVEFPIVEYGSTGAYVTLIQSTIADLFPDENIDISGVFTEKELELIKKIQEENGLFPSGIVDNDTWLLLQSLTGDVTTQISNDNFKIDFSFLPGTYTVSGSEVREKLPNFTATVSCDNMINVKFSAVAKYKKGTKTFSEVLHIKNPETISFMTFQKAFVYDPEYGMPTQVEFVIYPYNKKPYKWTIQYQGGGV